MPFPAKGIFMKRRTKAQWQALIEEQSQSGLTAVEFCKQRGINDKYFSMRKQGFLKARPEQTVFAVARIAPIGNVIEVKTGCVVINLLFGSPIL